MLVRYGKDAHGNQIKIATVYTEDEHNIDNKKISSVALGIIKTLRANNFQAYLVGGAVRDLILSVKPKDFDVVTNASPSKIRSLFRNSRIIGRRFKLVHVYFGKSDFVEVSTFRSANADNFVNIYGSMSEDVRRRDFTINSLYYDPSKKWIIDYLDGFEDLRNGVVRSIIPLNVTFNEDPVRLIRAVKYQIIGDLKMEKHLKKAISKYSSLLSTASDSRLTDEFFKILSSGHSFKIFNELHRFSLLKFLAPNFDKIFYDKKLKQLFNQQLCKLDSEISRKSLSKTDLLFFALYIFVDNFDSSISYAENFRFYFKKCKGIFLPLTPPNIELENAIKNIFKDRFGKSVRRIGANPKVKGGKPNNKKKRH